MHHDLYQAFAMSSAFNFSVSSFSHFEFESLLKKKNESFLSFLHTHSSLETVLANKRIAYQSWVLTKRENQGWHEKSLRHAVHGLTDLRNCRSMALVTGFWVEAFTHPALSNIENLELFSRIAAVLSWGFFLGILFHFRTGRQLSLTCVFQLCFTWRHETSWDSSVFQAKASLCVLPKGKVVSFSFLW